ncbi:MAG: class I SAM-dependent methyltransferase [Cyclobacteriaceae bacterium]
MKEGNPTSRDKLNIPKNARVLDVGSGHNPHPRANVVVDKFVDTNYHRAANIKVLAKQEFINADGENLPFKDNEFDYVIANHVLEHVDHPDKFLNELARVGKRGYVETPSLIGEHLIPKESHKWLLLDINNKLVIVSKERVNFHTSHDFGYIFLDYFQKNSIGYKILQRTHHQLFTVNYEWKDTIDYVLEPNEDIYMKYFEKAWAWDEAIYNDLMPQRSVSEEFMQSFSAMVDIAKSVFKSKVLKK